MTILMWYSQKGLELATVVPVPHELSYHLWCRFSLMWLIFQKNMICSNPKPLSNPQFDSNLPGYNMSSGIDKSSWLQYPGWWFQTCFIFHFIYGIIPTPWTNSIIFQDGCCTINQYLFLVIDKSDIIRIWFLSSYFPGTEQSTANGSSVFIFIPVGSQHRHLGPGGWGGGLHRIQSLGAIETERRTGIWW